jgi:hypothetical protein
MGRDRQAIRGEGRVKPEAIDVFTPTCLLDCTRLPGKNDRSMPCRPSWTLTHNKEMNPSRIMPMLPWATDGGTR